MEEIINENKLIKERELAELELFIKEDVEWGLYGN